MARRRGAGEGSLYRQGDRWVGQITYYAEGRRKRRAVYGRTQAEARAKLEEVKRQLAGDTFAEPSRMTLVQFLQLWMTEKDGDWRRTTAATYRALLSHEIIVRAGGLRLQRVRATDVDRLMRELAAAGVGARTRQSTFTRLSSAFRWGVRKGYIGKNPCDRAERPRAPKPRHQVLDPSQVRVLLTASRGTRLHALVVLALTTGMRRGELFGLRWGDVDLDAGTLHVQRQIVDVSGQLIEQEPKSDAGNRKLALPPLAVEALREHRIRGGALPHPERLVFSDTEGGPLRGSNFLRRYWYPLLSRAELPRVRFHDARHSLATLLLEADVPARVAQEVLGHSDVGVTPNLYSHVLDSRRRAAAQQVEELLR